MRDSPQVTVHEPVGLIEVLTRSFRSSKGNPFFNPALHSLHEVPDWLTNLGLQQIDLRCTIDGSNPNLLMSQSDRRQTAVLSINIIHSRHHLRVLIYQGAMNTHHI